jgi:hypothetical protein
MVILSLFQLSLKIRREARTVNAVSALPAVLLIHRHFRGRRGPADAQQIALGKTGETKRARSLPWGRLMKRFTDACEYITLRDPAGVAVVDGRSQPGKFGLILLFLALQRPQRGTDYFTGVLVPSALDLSQHEAFKLVDQVHIASRHGGVPSGGVFIVVRLAKIANGVKKP